MLALAVAASLAATPAAKPASAPSPLSPAAGWAISYLVSTILVAEYEAVLATYPPASEQRKAFLAGEAGAALWRRAAFAVASLRAKSQALPALPSLQKAVDEQSSLLKGRADLAAVASALAKAAASEQAPEDDAAAAAGHVAVAGSFAAAPMRDRWLRLARAYGMPSPSCPIDLADVRGFADHQKKLLAGDRGVNPQALVAPVASWNLPKVQCLVFALMASSPEAKEKDGYEPIHLMRALQQTASPLARDAALKALMAVRSLELGRYSETLALIVDLVDLDDAFRLPYEMVQRVYSIKQKGEGAVALQGL